MKPNPKLLTLVLLAVLGLTSLSERAHAGMVLGLLVLLALCEAGQIHDAAQQASASGQAGAWLRGLGSLSLWPFYLVAIVLAMGTLPLSGMKGGWVARCATCAGGASSGCGSGCGSSAGKAGGCGAGCGSRPPAAGKATEVALPRRPPVPAAVPGQPPVLAPKILPSTSGISRTGRSLPAGAGMPPAPSPAAASGPVGPPSPPVPAVKPSETGKAAAAPAAKTP